MKTSAEKSSVTTSKTAIQTANQPFFAKAGGGDFFAPAIQMKMAVNKPGDKFEQEADLMANKVMRMPAPVSGKDEKLQRAPEEKLQKKEEDKIQKKEDDKLQKAPANEEKLQRKGGDSAPSVNSNVQTAIQNKTGGGHPLSSDVRGYMEPRFNADFSNVRVHNDAESGNLSNQLSARAFTYQNHVFFSHDQYQPGTSEGKQLLAHELTHTIQQGHSVQRSPQVSTTTTPPPVQRFLGIDIPSWQDVLDWLAEKAYNIPGYRMFTIVIGVNPINGETADRSAANILRAIVEFLPGGKIITDALEKYGVFEKAGSWVEGQLKRFANLLATVKSAVSQFMDDIDFLDVVLHPVRTWERAVDLFTRPVNVIIDFIGGIFQAILQFVRDAVLMPLAALAQGKPGFDLLCAILGKNPITNEAVPRNADTLIGGFMKLIGQEEIWENIKKGNAVQKAWQWFENALQELFAMVLQFPQDFIAMLKSLEVMDFIILPNLFIKVFKVFGNFVVKFYSWAFGTILSLLEIIFSVVAPGVMPYVAKAKASFAKIIKDPIGFVGNLVKAGKQGFDLFTRNFPTHLKTALIKWITGPLGEAGVYIPKSFELMEIVKLVLSVLGLTWQNIRTKLVKIIPDPILAGLEKTAGILVTLVKDGPAAAWEQIKAELNELKGQLIAQVMQMVTTEIVKAAVAKLVMMLNPAGAFVQAVLAIWNTVTFFIQKIKQIGAAAAAFIDSIAAIAAGQIAGAAKKVEDTMARTLTVVIAFLAKFAGLGSIPEKIVGIVKKIRAPIDKGLDKIVGWLGNMLKKAGTAVLQAGVPQDPNERLKLGLNAAVAAVKKLPGNRISRALIVPLLGAIKLRYGFTSLVPELRGKQWWIQGVINPSDAANSGKEEGTPISAQELSAITRKVVVSEIQNNPLVRNKIQQPVGSSIVVGGPLGLPAAALQSREQLQQHKPVSGPPFVILAGDRPNQVNVDIGGGVVTEKRARAGASGAPLEAVMGFEGQGHYNPDVLNEIKKSGLSEQAFALNMRILAQTGSMEPGLTEHQRASIRKVTWLLFGTESARNIANIVHAPIATGMVEAGQSNFSQVLTSQSKGTSGGILPATMGNLPATARTFEGQLSQSVPGLSPRAGGQTATDTQVQALAEREYKLVMPFVIEESKVNAPSKDEAEKVVRVFVRKYYQMH